MTLWTLATVGHFLLTAKWLKRARTARNRDELWFQAMLAGTGSLSVTLHLFASFGVLSIPPVLLVLLAGHGLSAWATAGSIRSPNPEHPGLMTRAMENAAIIVLTAIVIEWGLESLESGGVSGSDAAHYHLPNAINMALGASLFDLPPTGHLYPMGSSTLAAWFLLPVETPLLTDLVMVLPFLLLISAMGWLFRQLTTLSGLAWSTWMTLALFGTRLFRSSSLMSADLLFAASTIAFSAALLTPLVRRKLTTVDVWLIALSLGILLGSKATGIVAAVVLGLPALLALAVFKVRREWTMDVRAVVWIGAVIAVLGAGGIWQVRNWWVWGSPLAPNGLTMFGIQVFPGLAYDTTRTYLSVFGDMASKPDYQLWERTRHFINIWLGSWYLPSLVAVLLIPLDAAASRMRSLRLGVLLVIGVSGAVIAWILIGAPWTSLEWTAGYSLRYALPWLALLPAVAWAGLFPVSVPWYRHAVLAPLGLMAAAAGGLMLFANQHDLSYPPLPSWRIVLSTIALLGLLRSLQFAAPRFVSAYWTAATVAVSLVFGLWMGPADQMAREARAAAIASGPRTNGERIFDTAIAFEAMEGRSCDAEGRRFFVTNRFDEAGTLQGPTIRNRVFYAARDVRVTSRVRPSMGACDYLITERAIMETDKGAMLHAGLNTSGRLMEIGLIGDVVLLVHR